MTITRPQIEAILRQVSDPATVTLVTRTAPDMRKTDNPYYGRLEKRSVMVAEVNYDYGQAVNDQRERDGLPRDFTPGPRPWGKRVGGTCLIEHKDMLYLDARIVSVAATIYLLDGKPIERRIVEPWLRDRNKEETKGPGVIVRTINLAHIDELTIGGVPFTIRHPESEAA